MKNVSLARVNGVLLLGVLVAIIFYYGRTFLVPLFFAILFAMLMLPLTRKLEKWGLGRKTATFVCILIILLCVVGIAAAITAQAANFSKDLPLIQKKTQELIDSGQQWIQAKSGVSPEKQLQFVKEQVAKFSKSADAF